MKPRWLTGSLGMLPSASLGASDDDGRRSALYEPVHGSAPDIAGRDIANPIATLLSFSMMLRYSFDLDEDADMIDGAIRRVLEGRYADGRYHVQGYGQGVHLGHGRQHRSGVVEARALNFWAAEVVSLRLPPRANTS